MYRKAWESFYSPDHVETILRRGAATGTPLSNLAGLLLLFSAAVPIERVHPLQCGFGRLKRRRDRRPTFPIEPIWRFYPAYAADTIRKQVAWARRGWAIQKLKRRVQREPKRQTYMDIALTPVSSHDTDVLALFTQSDAARAAVQRARAVGLLKSSRGEA